MKIIDYHVISHVNIDSLVAEVKRGLSMGWQPLGGMTSTTHPTGGNLELGPPGLGLKGTILFSQAMVKYQEDSPKTNFGPK